MKNRNTKQKEIILDVIKNDRNHPTIYDIYSKVKEIDSTIGQATVYRNVKKYIADNIIYVVKTKNGVDRYDYYDKHIHFECLKCGKVIDIFDDTLFKHLQDTYGDKDKKIIHYNLSLDGYCEECQKEEEII